MGWFYKRRYVIIFYKDNGLIFLSKIDNNNKSSKYEHLFTGIIKDKVFLEQIINSVEKARKLIFQKISKNGE